MWVRYRPTGACRPLAARESGTSVAPSAAILVNGPNGLWGVNPDLRDEAWLAGPDSCSW